LSVEEFIDACQPWLTGETPWRPEDYDPAAFAAVAELAQTRIALLAEIVPNVDFLFLPEPVSDEASWQKAMTDRAPELLAATLTAFGALTTWQAQSLKDAVEQVGAALGLKLGKAQAPVRVAVTGRTVGLPLFESLEVLGRERTLARIAAARARLASQA
jgi:glutamyl-tRNA synthetase